MPTQLTAARAEVLISRAENTSLTAARAEALVGASTADGDAPTLLAAITRHVRARHESHRVEAAQMAARLARWLGREDGNGPASLPEAAQRYVEDGSFADWARSELWPGDQKHGPPTCRPTASALSHRAARSGAAPSTLPSRTVAATETLRGMSESFETRS